MADLKGKAGIVTGGSSGIMKIRPNLYDHIFEVQY